MVSGVGRVGPPVSMTDAFGGAQPDAGAPSLWNAAGFLAGVLAHRRFAADGILSGADARGAHRVHWVVIDPDRHVLYAWRKSERSLVSSARDLGASVFTNGPFTNYPHGRLLPSLGQFGADAVRSIGRGGLREMGPELDASRVRHLQAPFPLGWVVGAHERINETVVSRPRIYWFGRGSGTAFSDYRIGRGDPVDAAEAIGGLFRGVTGYQATTVERTMRTGYWGLAPLAEGPISTRDEIRRAVELYRGSQDAPHGCRGLVVFVAGRFHTRRLCQLLVAAGVSDAVQIDGGDSLLLGQGRSVVLGRTMPGWKRVLQCWGIQFQPRSATAPGGGPG